MPAVFVQITNLRKRFGGRIVLDGVSLSIEQGASLAIMGPSGAGKTTLLRCLNGLEQPDAGRVRVGAHEIGPGVPDQVAGLAAIRRQVGFLFQQWNLFSHLTVLDNIIEAPIHVAGISREAATARARALLERVGITGRADAYPRHLSGGEQQRAAIARALAMEPTVLLLDEPTSALDRPRADELLRLLGALRATGLTLIAVTHDVRFAEGLAGRIATLRDGHVTEGPEPAPA